MAAHKEPVWAYESVELSLCFGGLEPVKPSSDMTDVTQKYVPWALKKRGI